MYTLGIATWCILLLLIQTSFLPHFRIAGVYPQLLMVFVVIFGLLKGVGKGAFLGVIVGLAQDAISGSVLGLGIFSLGLIGTLSGLIERRFFKENLLVPLFAVAVATLFYEGTFFLLLGLGGPLVEFFGAFQSRLPAMILYNLLVTLPVYLLFVRFEDLSWWVNSEE